MMKNATLKAVSLALAALLALALVLTGCDGAKRPAPTPKPSAAAPADSAAPAESETPAAEPSPAAPPAESPDTPAPVTGGHIVCIDAGHQRVGNSTPEPIGPGASETKASVTGGTQGRWTGVTEYELNLAVSLKLRDILTQRGYTVVMVRETNDVDISNSQRAAVAANANADIFVRIHANGSDDPNHSGAMTICMTPGNPYNASLYQQSRALSDCILDALVAATGCQREYVWETDTMSGINWAAMPVTIVEMGYMTNEQEDRLLATEDYRARVAAGIADGIDAYFARTA